MIQDRRYYVKKEPKVRLTQLKSFLSLGICVMNCSHEPNVLEVIRRRDSHVDLKLLVFCNTRKEYEFPFI